MAIDPTNLTPTTIRQEAVTRLIAASTAAGSAVYDGRSRSVAHDLAPCIVVHTTDARLTPRSDLGHPIFRRVENLRILAYHRIDTGEAADVEAAEVLIASRLDTLESEVLSAFFADATWASAFEAVEDVNVCREVTADAKQVVGVVEVTMGLAYTDEYRHTATNDLTLIVTDVDMLSPGDPDDDDDIEVTSHITIAS